MNRNRVAFVAVQVSLIVSLAVMASASPEAGDEAARRSPDDRN